MRDPHAAVDYILKHAEKFADARAQRVYLEEFKKSKKALLMQLNTAQPISAQERDAYAHPEYLELLEGLKIAVAIEEKLRWDLIAAQARVEIWRSEQANARVEIRNTQ